MTAATILIVDDFPSGRLLLQAVLEPLGYAVVTAENGQEALDRVKATPPDFILMDIEMPVMDGYAACRILKQDPATARIPLLMVTGLDDSENIRKALHEGADGYIMKPLNAEEVASKVPQLLELAKAGKLPGRFYRRPGITPPDSGPPRA